MYGINKRVLDPRRPRGATLSPDDKEEALVPYKGNLDIMALDILSYDLEVYIIFPNTRFPGLKISFRRPRRSSPRR